MADQNSRRKPRETDEEIVLLKDLAPRKDVKGGAKLRFGEPAETPLKPHR